MAPTMAGAILGTAAYMSPEQAKGKPVDRRADIWAFGAVLFEMLTGKPLYSGETAAETLASVMKEEPALEALPKNTPSAILNLLRRCLEKNLRQRLQHIGEARILIEGVLSGTGPANEPANVIRNTRERLPWVVAVMGVAAAIALSLPVIIHLRDTPPSAPEMRTEIVTPSTTEPASFALSPDGRQIVFAASGGGPSRLWLRRLDTTEAQLLLGTDGASFPFWSPDSRSVGFIADNRLKRIDLGGGSPQTLTNTVNPGATWSPDGTILFSPTTASVLFRIPASGGQSEAVTKLDKQSSHRFPQFLPGGRQFLFYAQGTPETSGIYLGSLDSSETKRLTAADTAGAYMPNGWLLFIRGGALVAQRLDLGRKELIGDPMTLADRVVFKGTAGAFSVSNAGLVAYRSGGTGQRQLVWFDRSGKMLGTMGALDANDLSAPSLSPDGHRAAVQRTVEGNRDIWLVDATRTTRFTFDAGVDQRPVWSRDGSRILFDSNRKGPSDLYMKPSNGAVSEELLLNSPQGKFATDWSRDGRFLLYSSIDPQTGWDIWVLPMDGDHKPFVFLKTNFDELRAQFSPDGHWVAYHSNESGRYEVYVRPFNGNSSAVSAGQWQVSTSGGMWARWRADSRELYYIAPDGKLMAAPFTADGATFQPGTPVALFQTRIYGGGADATVGTQYDVSGEGRVLINTALEEANSPITLLQNWTAGLKK